MRYKRPLLFLSFLISLTCVLIIWVLLPIISSSYTNTISRNWEINFPTDAAFTEVYKKDTGSSFHGDGLRYHVFTYKSDSVEAMLPWTRDAGGIRPIFYSGITEAASTWLMEIGVPKEEYPRFSECLSWYKSQNDKSEIIIFLDTDESKIYVIESFL